MPSFFFCRCTWCCCFPCAAIFFAVKKCKESKDKKNDKFGDDKHRGKDGQRRPAAVESPRKPLAQHSHLRGSSPKAAHHHSHHEAVGAEGVELQEVVPQQDDAQHTLSLYVVMRHVCARACVWLDVEMSDRSLCQEVVTTSTSTRTSTAPRPTPSDQHQQRSHSLACPGRGLLGARAHTHAMMVSVYSSCRYRSFHQRLPVYFNVSCGLTASFPGTILRSPGTQFSLRGLIERVNSNSAYKC